MREISLLASLEHPHIVRYIGTQRSPDKLFLFTEYITGLTASVRVVVVALGFIALPTAMRVAAWVTGFSYDNAICYCVNLCG